MLLFRFVNIFILLKRTFSLLPQVPTEWSWRGWAQPASNERRARLCASIFRSVHERCQEVPWHGPKQRDAHDV